MTQLVGGIESLALAGLAGIQEDVRDAVPVEAEGVDVVVCLVERRNAYALRL